MRTFLLIYALAVILTISLLGFRGKQSTQPPREIFPDMDRQERLEPQTEARFFKDNRADREPIPGTIPMITSMQEIYPHLQPIDVAVNPSYFTTGRADGQRGTTEDPNWGGGYPIDVTRATLERGQQQYAIFCSVCHGAVGDGNGITKQYGMATTASIIDQRVSDQPNGQIFNTITNGYNTMGAYGSKIRVEDRWAIIAYVRTLQRAANATMDDVPADMRSEL